MYDIGAHMESTSISLMSPPEAKPSSASTLQQPRAYSRRVVLGPVVRAVVPED